jgi:outer membrane protein assembly factor BamB
MSESPYDPSPQSDVAPSYRPRRRNWIAIGLLAVIAVGAQTRDVMNDRSVSNIITQVAVLIIALMLLAGVFRVIKLRFSQVAAVFGVLALIMAPFALLRFRGFSGEMVPVFESRFRASAELRKEIAKPTAKSQANEVATSSFAQFLGPDRNAVIATREFEIPDGDEVELWRVAIGQGWSGFAIEGQYCVTLEQRDVKECVTCYRLSDGGLLWMQEDSVRHKNPMGGVGPRSTPAIRNGMVYTQGATGIVYCLKLETGEVVWKQELMSLANWDQTASETAVTWGRSGSPLLVEDLCVIPFGRPIDGQASDERLSGRSLIALDAQTGEVKWSAGEDQISYASPVLMTLADVPQIVSVNEASVTGHSITDGTVLWSIPWPGQSNGGANCSSVLPVGENKILIAKGYGVGSGVFEIKREGDSWDSAELWTSNRVLKTKFTHACVDGDYAYALSDGTLECVDITTGERQWLQRGSRYGHGQIIRAGDCLVVQTEAGEVAFVAASPEEFKVLSTIDSLNDKTWNVPSIAGRYLAVRNDTEAVLYRLPEKKIASK